MTDLLVPRRYCGPPASGNGGWVSGALAALVPDERCPSDHAEAWPTVEVTLRMPPPLDTVLPLSTADGVSVATHDGVPVASARVVETVLTPIDPVDAAVARAAESAYPGLASHPFPTCFVCGTGREEGDGLRLFTGPIGGDGPTRVAATWVPRADVAEDWHDYQEPARHASLPVTWSAIDCPGGWAGDLTERLMVLGRMTARVDALPVLGEACVVVGEDRGREGRKTFTAASLHGADGRLLATAEHVWLAVEASAFR